MIARHGAMYICIISMGLDWRSMLIMFFAFKLRAVMLIVYGC